MPYEPLTAERLSKITKWIRRAGRGAHGPEVWSKVVELREALDAALEGREKSIAAYEAHQNERGASVLHMQEQSFKAVQRGTVKASLYQEASNWLQGNFPGRIIYGDQARALIEDRYGELLAEWTAQAKAKGMSDEWIRVWIDAPGYSSEPRPVAKSKRPRTEVAP